MTRAERVIRFIETVCRIPEGEHVGRPIKLVPFQKRFIRAVYNNRRGTSKAILSIARKNGKTALIAALVLVHLVGPEAIQNGQIISGAMSRDQASIVFKLCVKMINLNPRLAAEVRVIGSKKEIHGVFMGTEYRAIAKAAQTALGLNPALAILDEIGQIKGPRDDFVDSIVTAQGAQKNPLLIAISTQAADDADLLSVWIDDAKASADPHIVCHVYEAPKDAKLDDRAAWRAANPALGQFNSLKKFEQFADEAKRMPSVENTFRNYQLNQRVSVVSPFMSKSVWESCGKPSEYLDGLEVYGGLDLSQRTDLTSFVLIAKDSTGTWHVRPYFWTPAEGLMDRARRDRQPYDQWRDQGFLKTTPGATVDYEVVIRDIAELCEGLDVKQIAFDRWRMDEIRKEASRLNIVLPFAEFGQGFVSMAPALDAVEAEFLNGRVNHGMHPVLTMCAAGAVVAKDPAGNRKLDKSKATSRIDGLVALTMAFGIAAKNVEAPAPNYEIFYI